MDALVSKGRLSLEGNISLLQEHIRRDPDSYRAEFLDRHRHFLQLMRLLVLQSAGDQHVGQQRALAQSVVELTNFLASVAFCYPDECKEFSDTLQKVLAEPAERLDPAVRLAFCKALVTLVNRQMVPLFPVLELFFALLRCSDKAMRKFILGAVVSFIRELSRKGTRRRKAIARSKVRRAQTNPGTFQTFLFTQLKEVRPICVRIAQMALTEAYRKGYWRLPKVANVLSECVFHRTHRIHVSAMRFFLGSAQDEEGGGGSDDEDDFGDEEDQPGQDPKVSLSTAMGAFKHAKKTRKRKRMLESAKKGVAIRKRSKKGGVSTRGANLAAIRDLFDPQGFTDRLFALLSERRTNERHGTRLLHIALCARVIGVHRLQTLGFYSYLQRFLQPKQRDVTRILLYAAQACHSLVPEDLVDRLVRAISQAFVSDCNTPEAMAVGLNAIREIYISAPDAASEELVRDLVQYKTFRNKNVAMAARSLINVFRVLNPKLLHHKDRGRPPKKDPEMDDDDDEEEEEEGMMEETEGEERGGAGVQDEQEEEVEACEIDDMDENNDGDEDEEEEELESMDDEEEESEMDDDDMEMEEEEDPEPFVVDAALPTAAAKTGSRNIVFTPIGQGQEAVVEKKSERKSKGKNAPGAKKGGSANKKIVDPLEIVGSEKSGSESDQQEEPFERAAVDGLPRLAAIERLHKKRRQTKAERLAQVHEGRQGREPFNRPKKNGPHVGRTNRELAKRKNFGMVKKKVRGKNRQRSFRDRQLSLRRYLLKQSGRKVV